MRQLKNKFNLMLTALSVVALIFASSCGSDDPVPSSLSIEFGAASATIAESAGEATITLSFAAAPTAITVTANVSGTAEYSTDYTTSPAVANDAISLSIAEGATSATITFTAIDNNATDGDRTVILTLATATGIELGTNSVYTMTITDDDVAGESSITEDFESSTQSDGDNFESTGWINFAEAGSELWTLQEFGGNKYVEFSAFRTEESSNIGWLVLPKVNFDALAVAEMSFWNQIGFGDTNTLFELMYSTDFDGSSANIATSTWTKLTFNIATDDNVWVSSGAIDLSGISGNGYLAFRYEGNTNSDNDASYRVDNLIVGGATPTLTVTQSITDFGSVDNGSSSAEQSLTILGTAVSGDVTVSASNNFEVSTTSGSGFGSSVALADVSTEQTVFVRFTPTSGFNGAIDGSLEISSANALADAIALTGTEAGNVATNVYIEEDFDYGSTAGDLVTVSSSAWTGHSGSSAVGYATTSLSMTGYGSSGVGGSITITGSNSEDVNRLFASTTSGVIYAAALVSVTSTPSGETYFMHFKDGEGGFAFNSRVHAKDDGNGGINFGISEGSTSSSTLNYGTASYALNTTYLVVIKYDFTAGESTLYVLDNAATTEPANPEATSNDGSDASEIASIAFRQSGSIPDCTVDGVRVATDWAGVIGI